MRKRNYRLSKNLKVSFRDPGVSSFSFNFVKSEVNPIRKKKQFTNVEYLSYIGGLLGLFFGFSFVSFVELFYVFLFRTCLNFKSMRSKIFDSSSTDFQEKKTNFIAKFFKTSSIHCFNYIAIEKRKVGK